MNTPSSTEPSPSPRGKDVASTAEAVVRQHYAFLRPTLAPGMAITVLHVGARQTAVACGSGLGPDGVMVLDIGSGKTAGDFFRHDPPTPGEMENAIMAVEDEVTRARTLVVPGSVLFTTDEGLRQIAMLAGVADVPDIVLSVEAMERVFDRLASVTLGRPASQAGIPTGARFAATLLILREFMHHLQFAAITLKASPVVASDAAQ